MNRSFEPAPARGHYDRRQPREARLLEQRERLMSATALALAVSEAPTIAAVVELARVSRNTFYEYFDDLEHARAAATQRARQRLEPALRQAEQSARTPVERWRALVRAWFDWVSTDPAEARLMLVATSELSAGGAALEAALKRSVAELRALGVSAGASEAAHFVAAAAAGEAFARALVAAELASVSSDERPRRERLERALVEVIIRVLR
jgi:AcrR family transcriptional regulator